MGFHLCAMDDHPYPGCDWWRGRAEEDFERAWEMGNNALRLSVDWSRIEPREGVLDNGAIVRYRQMLTALREKGMEPMVTLHHFNDPLWLAVQGGWDNPAASQKFARFAANVVEAFGDLVAFDPTRPRELFTRRHFAPDDELSDAGTEGPYGANCPDGLYRSLMRLTALGKPILVTENGLPDRNDDQRSRFLLTHLAALHRALSQGANVGGYFHWTLVDDFEWSEGWGLRFGLIALDRETGERTSRPSSRLYGQICRENAITREVVEAYAPEAMGYIFLQS